MNKKVILPLAGLAVLLILAYIFSNQMKTVKTPSLPYFNYNIVSNTLTPIDKPGIRISTFSFKDQRSDVITEANVKGKIFVADYFFVSCPGICKTMGSQLQRVYKEFENERDFIILSHTSKPDEDSPAVLMDYSEKMGVKNQDKWLFLTGDIQDLNKVARLQYHIVDDPEENDKDIFVHTERFVLVDKEGFIRGYYDGTNPEEVDKMMKDIKLLLSE